MTKQETYQGFTNYETYKVHEWLTHGDDSQAFLTEIAEADELSMPGKKDLLFCYIWEVFEIPNNLVAELLLPVLARINCQEIIEHPHIIQEHERE
jgi:hypothetical protein